jgi:hypothetical protein
MNYDVSDLELIWRRGDGEMPEDLKHVVNAAREEKLLRSLQLSADDENTIRYNARKNNKTVNEYITSLITTSLHPA